VNSSVLAQQFKLAAIDLDGTLLGPDRQISPANLRAVQQLQQAGLQVVLASGRHHLNMRRYADALPGVEWIVSSQGGETADVTRSIVLSRDFLPAAATKSILELGQAQGFASMVYTVDRIFTDAHWNDDLKFYSDLSGRQPERLPTSRLMDQPVFKIIWMAAPEALAKAQAQITLPSDIQMVRTHDRLLELAPTAVTKATGLQHLTTRLGVDASEVMAFGDGDNDVPMFEWARVSFAMAHGWPAALQTATHVTPAGPLETAFARGVEYAFESGLIAETMRPKTLFNHSKPKGQLQPNFF
jgi:Cof subfamily protein (haloacid dehalogenase superfamily)